MIISGFPCIGKSYLARQHKNVIDLESSIFCKGNFEQYLEYIKYFDELGYVVFCSAHDNIRNLMLEKGVDYTFVKPKKEDKNEYRCRSDKRQPHPLKTEFLINNWEKFLMVKENEKYIELDLGQFVSSIF